MQLFAWLLCRFDAVLVSSEVGYEKPDARIFKTALGSLCKLDYSSISDKEIILFNA